MRRLTAVPLFRNIFLGCQSAGGCKLDGKKKPERCLDRHRKCVCWKTASTRWPRAPLQSQQWDYVITIAGCSKQSFGLQFPACLCDGLGGVSKYVWHWSPKSKLKKRFLRVFFGAVRELRLFPPSALIYLWCAKFISGNHWGLSEPRQSEFVNDPGDGSSWCMDASRREKQDITPASIGTLKTRSEYL